MNQLEGPLPANVGTGPVCSQPLLFTKGRGEVEAGGGEGLEVTDPAMQNVMLLCYAGTTCFIAHHTLKQTYCVYVCL